MNFLVNPDDAVSFERILNVPKRGIGESTLQKLRDYANSKNISVSNVLDHINEIDAFKFAVDVPSGLDPQTGETANVYTKCDMTVTFHKMKQGIPKRKDLTGEVFVEKIGIPPEAEDDIL